MSEKQQTKVVGIATTVIHNGDLVAINEKREIRSVKKKKGMLNS